MEPLTVVRCEPWLDPWLRRQPKPTKRQVEAAPANLAKINRLIEALCGATDVRRTTAK